jgi:hypothetical protein
MIRYDHIPEACILKTLYEESHDYRLQKCVDELKDKLAQAAKEHTQIDLNYFCDSDLQDDLAEALVLKGYKVRISGTWNLIEISWAHVIEPNPPRKNWLQRLSQYLEDSHWNFRRIS